jgi:hypothetical protein
MVKNYVEQALRNTLKPIKLSGVQLEELVGGSHAGCPGDHPAVSDRCFPVSPLNFLGR